MKIALIETNLTGHRITYLECYFKALLSQGHEVHIYSPKLTEISINSTKNLFWNEYAEPNDKEYSIERFKWSLDILNKWTDLSKAINKKSPDIDLVFFMGLDFYRFGFGPMLHSRLSFLIPLVDKLVPYFLNRYFKFKWAGVSILPDFSIDQIFHSKNCIYVGVLNEFFEFQNKTLNIKKIVLPDITNIESNDQESHLVKSILQKANGRKIISILGSIDKRKSVFAFLEAAELCYEKQYFFLIAGESRYDTFNEMETETLRALKINGRENCYFHFERVTDGIEFNSLMKITDVVFASYLNFNYSSNILTKIAYFKKPVIVSNKGIMPLRVKKYNLGVCIEEGKISEIITAIDKILSNFDHKAAKFYDYYYLNSQDYLKNSFERILQKIPKNKFEAVLK